MNIEFSYETKALLWIEVIERDYHQGLPGVYLSHNGQYLKSSTEYTAYSFC